LSGTIDGSAQSVDRIAQMTDCRRIRRIAETNPKTNPNPRSYGSCAVRSTDCARHRSLRTNFTLYMLTLINLHSKL